MPIWVGARAARISQAAPWISGPNVTLSQCFSNKTRSNSSRLTSSVGSGKISTAAPSGSISSFGRATAVIPLLLLNYRPGSTQRSAGRLSGPAPSTIIRTVSAHQIGIHDPTVCLARFGANALDVVNHVLELAGDQD